MYIVRCIDSCSDPRPLDCFDLSPPLRAKCHGPHVEGSTQQLLGQPRGSICEGQAQQEKLKARPIGWIILDPLT
ncbi:unnamed protein product [Prunus brigantina]